jgi:hypothetical protein
VLELDGEAPLLPSQSQAGIGIMVMAGEVLSQPPVPDSRRTLRYSDGLQEVFGCG